MQKVFKSVIKAINHVCNGIESINANFINEHPMFRFLIKVIKIVIRLLEIYTVLRDL